MIPWVRATVRSCVEPGRAAEAQTRRPAASVDLHARSLRDELTGNSLTENLHRMADAQYCAALATHDTSGEIEQLRQAIADPSTTINRYHATIDAGGDPVPIAEWISETTVIRRAA